tara:strand:+ start:199 stop:408 length:210 start_codon:yes stop_codon:yes gene_type:complete
MKQTAVEQFLNAIKDQINLSQEHLEMIESYASQAKEMEKEQIKDAYERGDKYKTEIPGEQYYKLTFKSE